MGCEISSSSEWGLNVRKAMIDIGWARICHPNPPVRRVMMNELNYKLINAETKVNDLRKLSEASF
jgi:hypothetical protein